MRRFIAVAAVGVLGFGLAGCGGDDDSASDGDTTTTAGGAESDTDASDGTVTVVATNFQFDPAEITAPHGEEVVITLRNEGSVAHTFTSDALGVDEEVAPGDSAEITVTVPHEGSAEFHCRFHEGSGMVGSISPPA